MPPFLYPSVAHSSSPRFFLSNGVGPNRRPRTLAVMNSSSVAPLTSSPFPPPREPVSDDGAEPSTQRIHFSPSVSWLDRGRGEPSSIFLVALSLMCEVRFCLLKLFPPSFLFQRVVNKRVFIEILPCLRKQYGIFSFCIPLSPPPFQFASSSGPESE